MGLPETAAELTTYIEGRFHARHREQLPELKSLSTKVEAVHAENPHVPAGLADLLADMIGELEVHMKKEELVLCAGRRWMGVVPCKTRGSTRRKAERERDGSVDHRQTSIDKNRRALKG